MDFEFRSLWGPSSQVTFSARRALIAFQVLSATTAIAESLILSTKVTPGICLAAAASKSATLPPMTSQRASAAYFIPGTRKSIPYTAEPFTFDGVSRRGVDFPTIL